MNSLCLIDEKLFYRYLELEGGYRLSAAVRKRLSPAIAYWNEGDDLRDLRRLALGLAELHSPHPVGTRPAHPTPEYLKQLFAQPTEQQLNGVQVVDKLATSTTAQVANVFYSALVNMSPISLAQVLDEEMKRIGTAETAPGMLGKTAERSAEAGSSDDVLNDPAALQSVFLKLHNAELKALCFSGGGIRSATFGLGIVQGLARYGLLQQFDYLSTVSGGGYLGSWLSAWICREHKKRPTTNLNDRTFGVQSVERFINSRRVADLDDPNSEPSQLKHLREYSNYMSPRTGLLSADTWTLIAIYFRNLLLNLTIFISLIAAILMLPRFLFRTVIHPYPPAMLELGLLIVAVLAGAFSIAFVISRLPSKTRDESLPNPKTRWERFKAFLNVDPGVLVFGVLPLLLCAFLSSVLWVWHFSFGTGLGQFWIFSNEWLQWNNGLGYFLLVTATAYVIGLVIFLIIKFRTAEPDVWAGSAAFFTSLIGGVLLWVVSSQLFPHLWIWFFETVGDGRKERYFFQLYLSLSVPVFLIVVLISASVFIGFTSRTATDEDREWLARYGAWVLIVGGVWFVLNMLVMIGPSIIQWMFNFHWGDLFSRSGLPAILSSLVALLSGVVSLVGGFSERSLVRDEPSKSWTSRILSYAPKVAATIFLGFIFVGLAYVATWLFYLVGPAATLDHVTALQAVPTRYLLIGFAILVVVGVGMACFVNVNKFSLHGAYRDRLVRAYLGASNKDRKQNTFTGFDDSDNLELHELENQQPLHIINGTVNLVGGKNLAWQNRKAASFTMSPLHCGSWAVNGYRRSREYCRSLTTGKALRLGTAMAISGAAANPNMGYYSSSIVTFLMSLFNIRLGWWLGNTGEPGSAYHWFGRGRHRFFEKVGPSIAVLPLLNETLGRTDESKRFLMVTDGGHFENLALYEMVLRRCKLIVLSDGAADAEFKFGEIANAIQKCKVDLGVDIEFVGSMNIRPRSKEKEEEKVVRSRFAIAKITYPETYTRKTTDSRSGVTSKEEENYVGWLLYTRPTYYKDEPRDILNYAESNEQFPHQSTGDQMYDEKQFEAYRGLGLLTMAQIRRIFDATSKGDPDDEVDDELERMFEKELDLRKTLFDFFRLPDADAFRPRRRRGLTE